MRFDAGSTNLTASGTAQVVISSDDLQIVFIQIKAKPSNAGDIYFGVSDVSSSNKWTLKPGEETSIDFDPQGKGTSISQSLLFFDGANTNDDLEWQVLYKQ